MAENILRLRVDSKEYDSKITRAKEGLLALEASLKNSGKTFADADKNAVSYVRALGRMETASRTARGRISEMSSAFLDLSVQYNKLSQAEKNSPFGKAMAESLSQLKQRTIDAKREIDGLNSQIQNVKTPETGAAGGFLGGKLGNMVQVAGGIAIAKVAGMATELISGLGESINQSIELAQQGEGIRIAFERLGRGDLLAGLREATHGTVSDLELMKAAVKFNDFKLPLDELGTMLAFAQQKAKDTGQSVDYMVDSIVTGLGRQSLMILDNLGLSATEIRDRMKETGDMTKAVGAIIRDQMSNAGNYIETAADKATQADVKIKNAMIELGNTLQPLASDFSSFWTDLKVSGLSFLNDVMKPIVQEMTRAGQVAKAVNRMGGQTEIGNQLSALSSSDSKQLTFLNQLASYDKQIGELQSKIDKLVIPAAGPGAQVALGQRSDWNFQLQGLLQMREEYRKQAMEIISPAAASSSPIAAVVSGAAKAAPLAGSADYLQQYIKDMTTQRNAATDQAERDRMNGLIFYAEKMLDRMLNKFDKKGYLFDDNSSLSERLGIEPFKTGGEKIEGGAETYMPQKENNLFSSYNKAVGGLSSISGGLKQIGIEVPESVDQLLGALQGVSSIISGVTSIIEAFGIGATTANTVAVTANTAAVIGLTGAIGANTFSNFIPFFSGGGIIHAANGYRVPGNFMSNDMVPAMVNSGEIILNRAQQGIIANDLQNSGMRNLNLQAVIYGDQIRMVLNNTSKTKMQGQYITSRSR